MRLSRPLSEDGTARRYAFAREYGGLLDDSPGVLNVAWFSSEAQFHLDGYIKKKKSDFGHQRIQGLPLPTHYIQREL
jgi:hypothetical protein